jgi:hypothetical protein
MCKAAAEIRLRSALHVYGVADTNEAHVTHGPRHHFKNRSRANKLRDLVTGGRPFCDFAVSKLRQANRIDAGLIGVSTDLRDDVLQRLLVGL